MSWKLRFFSPNKLSVENSPTLPPIWVSLCSEGCWASESVCSAPDDADQSEELRQRRVMWSEQRVEVYLSASSPPSPPGVLLFWTRFNISWRAVCAAPPAPQHALNLHIFWEHADLVELWGCRYRRRCFHKEDGEHDVNYVQLLPEHRLSAKYCFSVKLLRLFDSSDKLNPNIATQISL